MKVETHNHPTAIAPFPGAATGSGGEIRDEGATGSGAKPKAGLVGFTVSHLRVPGPRRAVGEPRSTSPDASPRRSTSCSTVRSARPSFNNEFGRPNLGGYFRTFEQRVDGEVRGYHKPIMIAGGVGNIDARHTHKRALRRGHADRAARRPGIADRPGRRRGLVDGDRRRTPRTSISTRCSAATPRSSAAPGSHRPLLAAGRREPDPVDPRRRRGRPVERAAGARARRRRAAAGFDLRDDALGREPACRRARSGATRRRSATCSRSRPATSRAFDAICRARALPLRRGRPRARRRPAAWSRIRASATGRSTCRST